MNFEVIGQAVENAKIKVVGVGGAGGNAVISQRKLLRIFFQ